MSSSTYVNLKVQAIYNDETKLLGYQLQGIPEEWRKTYIKWDTDTDTVYSSWYSRSVSYLNAKRPDELRKNINLGNGKQEDSFRIAISTDSIKFSIDWYSTGATRVNL